ncbi:MAG: DNA translocase FtsK [Pseudomonadota bacterium]
MATRAKGKRRAPLIESETEEALRRRGAEFLGLILIAVSFLALTLVWTYSPDDPSLFMATDTPPRNALGLVGAYIADPLIRALGWAAFGVPLTLAVWGFRFMFHTGEARVVTRLVTLPIALLAAAAFAATHVPVAGWQHDFGLGGLLGDAILSNLIPRLPLEIPASLTLASLVLGLLFLITAAFALGVTRSEAGAAMRYLGHGAIAVYIALHTLASKSAQALAARRQKTRAHQSVETATPTTGPGPLAKPKTPTRIPREIPRFLQPRESQEEELSISEKISAAVKARSSAGKDDDTDAADSPVMPMVLRASAENEADLDDALYGDGDTTSGATNEAGLANVAAPRASKPTAARMRPPERRQADPEFPPQAYERPDLGLLENPNRIVRHHLGDAELEENARMLEGVLDDYGVRGEIVSIRPGPVVTMYELEPAAGLKASRVIGLSDDIARSMSALACRVSTIPGRSVIGIELPNDHREKVLLREILAAPKYSESPHPLPLALGKDIGGDPVVTNLARMPHLLIAGTTGSGKSVAINTMILSLLYKLAPDECRLIMIDPKMLELSVYDGIPHLLSPVVTDPKKAVVALKWVVAEMEERYRKMSKIGVRNIDGYNERVREALGKGEAFTRTVQTGFDDETGEPTFETEEFQPETMSYIVVIVDEMADLMMVAGKEIEACIQRLAQMARASGIHLIMATQRPSVDVITGTIKANFPTRISFQVTSKIDSRTILGEMGAEQLLGMGDMLYMAGGGRITRIHGPFVSDAEVEDVVRHLKDQGPPSYEAGVVDGPEAYAGADIDLVLGLGGNTSGDDALYDQAVAIVAKDRKCSTSYIQRKLAIGYNKAARLVEQMEDEGVVSQANHVGKREVLVAER